jgi:uncharacterized protein YdaU (DUF1376 family)
MSRQWIAFYTGDYLRDTRHLTVEEHGAYLLLLMECWTHGRIPMEPSQQAALVRVSAYRWQKLWRVLEKFFHEDGTNKRATREVEKADAVSLRRSISGQIGGRKSGLARTIARGEASKTEAKSNQTASKNPSHASSKERSNCEANHNSSITTTSFIAAREEEAGETLPPPALASALCDGALAPGANSEQAAPKRLSDKKPNEMTKEELDQLYVERRARAAEVRAEHERRTKAVTGITIGPDGGLPF